ncbi:VWA domain-containing protein, partial [bacterium]|nr:VWA domain-containing protein [bacterium]
GAYYLDLRRLPSGAGTGACQLVVRLSRGGKPQAVARVPLLLDARAEELDVVLLIDESLSMLRTDRRKLRIEAAKTFVDLATRSTRIRRVGIAAFNHRARTLVPLTSLAQADALHKAIEGVRASGQTDIDRALELAHSLFEGAPANTAKAVVLLTDGKDEPGRYEDAHRIFAERRWRVFTVGLSERADHDVLRRIARDTGGTYHDAPTSADLQDIFSKIALALQKQVAIRSRTLRLPAAMPVHDPFRVDDTLSAMTVRLQAGSPAVAFALRDPSQRVLTPDLPADLRSVVYRRKAAHQYFNVWSPRPGAWQARLTAPQADRATVTTTAVTPLLVRAFPLKPSYYRGEPVELAVSLAHVDAVLADAQVVAHITDPKGGTTTVRLHDDGRHQDTGAADGVFAGVYAGTEQAGTLRVRLVATGTTPGGHPFERELALAATIAEEGRSKLWAAAAAFDFGVVYNGETAACSVGVKLTSAAAEPEAETVRTALDLPAAGSHKLVPRKLALTPAPLRLEPSRLTPVRLALTIPSTQPEGRYRGQLRLISRYHTLALPITLEVRHPTLVLGAKRLDLGAVESGDRTDAELTLRLEPRGELPVRLTTTARDVAVAAAPITVGAKPVATRVALAPPADRSTASVEGTLTAHTPLGKSTLPVVGRVVRPALKVTPAELDFGQLAPAQAAEQKLTLVLDGVKPREATLTATPLAGKGTPLPLTAAAKTALAPGKAAVVAVRLSVPPVQAPGEYRGSVEIVTPLGKHRVPAVARVARVATFRVAATLDFGRVAIGSAKEMAVEVASLASAPQTLKVSPPAATAAWRLEATPATLELPAKGKARITFRLTAAATAPPGPQQATVKLAGPSQDATLDVRVELFRPPHESLVFDGQDIDLGYVHSGEPAQAVVSVRSIVAEAQPLAVAAVDAPPDLLRVVAQAPGRIAGRGSASITLSLLPKAGLDVPTPFEARLVVRGRSEPTSVRLHGVILPPLGATFALTPAVLDFGSMRPGESRALPLAAASLHPFEQDLVFGEPPADDGLLLSADPSALALPPEATATAAIHLAIAADAPAG